jgi:hypothetical protein
MTLPPHDALAMERVQRLSVLSPSAPTIIEPQHLIRRIHGSLRLFGDLIAHGSSNIMEQVAYIRDAVRDSRNVMNSGCPHISRLRES